jgi:hypothetical protein
MKKLIAVVMTLGVLVGASGCKDNREKVFRDGMIVGSALSEINTIHDFLNDPTLIDTLKKENINQDLFIFLLKGYKERFETSNITKGFYQEYVENNYDLNLDDEE